MSGRDITLYGITYSWVWGSGLFPRLKTPNVQARIRTTLIGGAHARYIDVITYHNPHAGLRMTSEYLTQDGAIEAAERVLRGLDEDEILWRVNTK